MTDEDREFCDCGCPKCEELLEHEEILSSELIEYVEHLGGSPDGFKHFQDEILYVVDDVEVAGDA